LKTALWIIGLLVAIQAGTSLLEVYDHDRGLIWLGLTVLYHYPVSWIGEPLFVATEIGWYPTTIARVLTTAAYVAMVLGALQLIRKF
jgi:hypothetical protein